MGKGSAARPFSVSHKEFAAKHDAIFGKRERTQWVPPPPPGEQIAGFDVVVDPSLPPDVIEIRGTNTVRLELGEVVKGD